MSGRTKRILYHIADGALYLVFGIGMLILSLLVPPVTERAEGELWQYPLAFALSVVGLPVLIHECGHLLFGALAGMKPARFGFRPLSRGSVAGETAMYPKNGKHVRGKFFALTLGGAAVNIALGVALFLLWLLLLAHPAGCGALSGFVFYEGLRSLLPADLPAGKTDGAVLCGIFKGAPEEDVALRVLTAQGILFRGSFSAVPYELLFGAPVVREDLPAFHALLLLRAQWLLFEGREEEAEQVVSRALAIEDLTEGEREEFLRYEGYFAGTFETKKEPLSGLGGLEKKLKETAEKRSSH